MTPRRDRHGRGLRRPLLPTSVPAWRSRSSSFDETILDAVDSLDERWSAQLADIEFAVEDVPPGDIPTWEADQVTLGRCFPARGEQPARIVVYRRPVENRAEDEQSIADLVRSVVVEQFAHLMSLPPQQIDPDYTADEQ